MSEDPVFGDVADPFSTSAFGYARHAPTRFTDPDGRIDKEKHASCMARRRQERRSSDVFSDGTFEELGQRVQDCNVEAAEFWDSPWDNTVAAGAKLAQSAGDWFDSTEYAEAKKRAVDDLKAMAGGKLRDAQQSFEDSHQVEGLPPIEARSDRSMAFVTAQGEFAAGEVAEAGLTAGEGALIWLATAGLGAATARLAQLERASRTRKLTGLELDEVLAAQRASFDNFRRRVDPSDLRGAPPSGPGRPAGHARSKHGITRESQAEILNGPDRVFSGVNDNGRKVDIYLSDGTAVITEAGNKTSVITAHGRAATKGGRKPVSPNKFTSDPNFVEVIPGENRVIHSTRSSFENGQ